MFDRAIEHFGGQYGGNAKYKQAPLEQICAQYRRCRDNHCRDKEVNEKVALTSHPALATHQGAAEFSPQRLATRGIPQLGRLRRWIGYQNVYGFSFHKQRANKMV
jgi:hypothetical protein